MAENTSLTTSPELVEYILLLYRKWKLILVVTAVFSISGMIYTYLKTPVYQSTATIYIEEPLSRNNLLSDIIVMQWWNRTSSERLIASSRSVATLAVEKLGLDYHVEPTLSNGKIYIYRIVPSDRERLEQFTIKFTNDHAFDVYVDNKEIGYGTVGIPFTSSELSFYIRKATNVSKGASFLIKKGSLEDAVENVRENTNIQEVGEMTNILKVSCKNKDPYLASLITNEIINAYIELSIQRMSQEASQALTFISEQLNITNQNLIKAEDIIDQFQKQHGIISLKEEVKEAISRISELEKERLEIELKIKDANSLKDMLENDNTHIGDYLISSSDHVLDSMVQELTKLEIQKKAMLQEYTERYPGVIQLNVQIEETKEKIRQMLGSILNQLKIQQNNINLYEKAYYKSLADLPALERQYAALERDLKVNEELYDFLLKKHEEARISKAATVANIRIIDKAIPSKEPIEPKKGKNALVSFLLGFIFSLIIAFYTEYTDTSLKTVDDARRRLTLPIFGIIPQLPRREANGDIKRHLITMEDLKSTVTEAYRSLRTNIQFVDLENKNKCFMITSSGPGEGKSTTAANVAITLAYADMPTILIDADFRKPIIHTLFGLEQEPGFTNYIISDIPLSDVIKHTSTKNLDVLTVGIIPPNPSELLSKPKVDALIKELKRHYSYIIFDTAPVLPVTDPAILGSKVDGAFIVVELGRTTIEAVSRAHSLLTNTKTNVYGVILNKISMTVGRYGHYYYYYHYDKYYHQKKKKNNIEKAKDALLKVYKYLIG
ncbi:MAG: GumC family protein [bacterium]